jgi:hypothetical protein
LYARRTVGKVFIYVVIFMRSFTEKMLQHQKPKSSQPSCSGWMKNNDLKRLNFVSLHTTAEDELKPAHFT